MFHEAIKLVEFVTKCQSKELTSSWRWHTDGLEKHEKCRTVSPSNNASNGGRRPDDSTWFSDKWLSKWLLRCFSMQISLSIRRDDALFGKYKHALLIIPRREFQKLNLPSDDVCITLELGPLKQGFHPNFPPSVIFPEQTLVIDSEFCRRRGKNFLGEDGKVLNRCGKWVDELIFVV